MDPKANNRLVFGSEKLLEELDGLKYEISLSSFFQVNKPATLVLYSTIKEYVAAAGLAQDMVLLDLCCGTGTIGMMMAPHVGKIIGVELVPEAIADARRNAELNGITNIEFKCAKVEDVIGEVIASIPPTVPIAVILDPPRSGIHKSVIKSIRNCPRVSSLVFVSCNPKACLQNYADLGKEASRATSGRPFALARAVPVDMFPMTEHCELVLKFDRL
jgi:tRNA (uracil-5-)-methyltransferase